MAQSIEKSLLEAVKKDDIKAFNALTEKARCGEYRLGRFPMLSLMYLYKSRRLISAYEEKFVKIRSYTELGEPLEVSKKFVSSAGKCLRLYFGEIVSPLEMLLILDRVKRLKRIYPLAKPSAEVKGRLKSIYSIKYSLSVKFEGDNIILDRRPLSLREKKNIAAVCLCSVLAVTLAVGVPVTAVSLMPEPVEGEVTNLSQIDFSSKEEYNLKRDIVLPENFSAAKVNCRINGEGHKLIAGQGASLGELNGNIYDLTIESAGGVLFTSVSEAAVIKNVTVNVCASVASAENTALVAVTNYGTIDGVTLNVSGKINALAPSGQTDAELTFGGIVLNNSYKYSSQTVYRGVIKNCTANYYGFALEGEALANAVFGGIAGVNSGYVQNCTVTGEINADTFDVAGVCAVNNGMLTGNANEADILHTSADSGWNPISCGIVLNNTYAVESCINRGKISSVSACPSGSEDGKTPVVSSAGIAYITSNTISGCTNSGEIYAEGVGEAYAGGIASHSYAQLYNCLSCGDITVKAESIYAGGILACSEVYYEANFFGYSFAWGEAFYCISECNVNITPINENTPAYAGGIIGFIKETSINNGGTLMYFGGGVSNCYFTGACSYEGSYFGNIVGVCGANIYESNSYVSGNTEYHNFEGNYYAANSFKAFGGASDGEGLFTVEDKGAESAPIEDIRNSEIYKSISEAVKR